MPSTSNVHGAREHARAQSTARVVSQPTVPASAAADRPSGVAADAMLWEETLADGAYAARRLPRGARLRMIDVDGDACATLMVHRAGAVAERLNVADTVKVQWNAYLDTGSLLLSDMGRVLMAVEALDGGSVDALCGPGPNARDRLLLAMAKYDLGRRDLPPALCVFADMRVGGDGSLRLDTTPRPGAAITLRAEVDVIVSLVNVPHRLDTTGRAGGPVRVSAWAGRCTEPGDPIRHSTPERLRAYENTEESLRAGGDAP